MIILLVAGWQVWQFRRRAEKPFDPAFLRLSPLEIAGLPLAVRFDQPMSSEHGALTYNAGLSGLTAISGMISTASAAKTRISAIPFMLLAQGASFMQVCPDPVGER